MLTKFICQLCSFPTLASKYQLDEASGEGRVRLGGSGRGDDRPIVLTTQFVTRIVCERGHASLVAVQDGGHARLFERALRRLARGLTRDAVLDAHTALEMFVSHIPAWVRYNREPASSPRVLYRELRSATKTAERAWAAAIAAVSIVSREAPPSIDESAFKTRNDAVHAGVYPTEADAENHLCWVERTVIMFESILHSCRGDEPRAPSYWRALFYDEVESLKEKTQLIVTTWIEGTALDVNGVVPRPPTASGRVASYRNGLADWYPD